MRLIDADALDTAFTDLRWGIDGQLGHWGDRPDWNLHGYEIERLIRDAPTVEIADILKLFPPFPAGYCATCAMNSDHNDHSTRCPIEEHYVVPADGYCHLYEEFSPIKKKEMDF